MGKTEKKKKVKRWPTKFALGRPSTIQMDAAVCENLGYDRKSTE